MRLKVIRWLVVVLAAVGASSALAQEAPPRVTHGSLLIRTHVAGRPDEVPRFLRSGRRPDAR